MLHTVFEQILEASPDKTAAVQPLIPHLTNHPRKMNKTCWSLLGKKVIFSYELLHIDTLVLVD